MITLTETKIHQTFESINQLIIDTQITIFITRSDGDMLGFLSEIMNRDEVK